MTAAQHQAYHELWPKYGLGTRLGEQGTDDFQFEQLFDEQFSAHKPLMLEIGFGMGDSLLQMATRYPQHNYLGIEVHTPGVGRLLRLIAQQQISNLKVFHTDALWVLQHYLPESVLDAVYIFFPDPWPKKRHHKRRLIQVDFVHLLDSRLKPGGLFHVATDWENYAQWIIDTLDGLRCAEKNTDHAPDQACLHWRNLADSDTAPFVPRPEWRLPSKFERKGLAKGHIIRDILYQKEKT